MCSIDSQSGSGGAGVEEAEAANRVAHLAAMLCEHDHISEVVNTDLIAKET